MCTPQEIAKAVSDEMCSSCQHTIECDFNCMQACGEIMRKQMESKEKSKEMI